MNTDIDLDLAVTLAAAEFDREARDLLRRHREAHDRAVLQLHADLMAARCDCLADVVTQFLALHGDGQQA